jgi:hypothetical protein
VRIHPPLSSNEFPLPCFSSVIILSTTRKNNQNTAVIHNGIAQTCPVHFIQSDRHGNVEMGEIWKLKGMNVFTKLANSHSNCSPIAIQYIHKEVLTVPNRSIIQPHRFTLLITHLDPQIKDLHLQILHSLTL